MIKFSNKSIYTFLVIILVIVLGGVVVSRRHLVIPKEKIKEEIKEEIDESESQTQKEEKQKGPEGWQSYTDSKNVYRVYYPSDWEGNKETLEDNRGGPYYSGRVFSKAPAKEFLSNLFNADAENGILVFAGFTKLPLETFIKHRGNISLSFLDAMGPSEQIMISGKEALSFTSESATAIGRIIAVKNNDYVITIFMGPDYKEDVYDKIIKNIELISQKEHYSKKKDEIPSWHWKSYKNNKLLGYYVPGYSLSMEIPSEFEKIDDYSFKYTGTDIRFLVGVNSFAGELKESFKNEIIKYKNMSPGDIAIEEKGYSSDVILKLADVNLNGCKGVQLYLDPTSAAANTYGYQTLCSLGDNIGEKTVIFLLETTLNYIELDQYKQLYDDMLSTFRYQER